MLVLLYVFVCGLLVLVCCVFAVVVVCCLLCVCGFVVLFRFVFAVKKWFVLLLLVRCVCDLLGVVMVLLLLVCFNMGYCFFV